MRSTCNILHFMTRIISSKKHLDVFETVNAMRAQRIKMVQKPEQYVYIFKCLRDEIRINQGNYYEV